MRLVTVFTEGARMIRLTRLDGSQFYLNADLLQTVESCPDTHIHLTTGTSYVVRETDEEVVRQFIAFRREVGRAPRSSRANIRALPARREARK